MNVDPGPLRAELQAVEDAVETALSALDSVRRQLDDAETADAEAALAADAEAADVEPAPADAEPLAHPAVEPAPADEP